VHAATLFGPEERERTFLWTVGSTGHISHIHKGQAPKNNVNIIIRVIT
jgi:hypothetical protein